MMPLPRDAGVPAVELPAPWRRVYLVGFMGAGKTTVGRRLADELGYPFQDLDRKIERRQGMSVAEIFERHGEAAFRRLESRALDATEGLERGIFATGGGILHCEHNRSTIRRLGRSVWLDPEFETLRARCRDEGNRRLRPLWRDEGQARELYDSRREAYGRADDRIAIGAAETASEVTARIIDLIRTWPV